MQETQFDSWVRKMCWRRDRLPTPVSLGFPCDSAGKESTCYMGHLGSIPGLGRSSREGKGCLLQYFGLKNSTEWGLKESDMTEQISFSFTFFCGQFTLRDCVLKEEGYLFPWYIFLSTLREWISHVSVIFDRLLFRQSSVVLFTCVSTSIPLFTKN